MAFFFPGYKILVDTCGRVQAQPRHAGSWPRTVHVREGRRHTLGVGTRGQERARGSVSQTRRRTWPEGLGLPWEDSRSNCGWPDDLHTCSSFQSGRLSKNRKLQENSGARGAWSLWRKNPEGQGEAVTFSLRVAGCDPLRRSAGRQRGVPGMSAWVTLGTSGERLARLRLLCL